MDNKSVVDQLIKLKSSLVQQQPQIEFPSVENRLSKFEERKIKFDIVSREEAKDFLTNNTYLYKISLYKDNFYTKNNREFIDLDFAYLKDLSTIDMHIRYSFLKLCLDIEHGIKTTILAYFNKKNSSDGYSIVDRYIQSKHDKKNNNLSIKELQLKILEYASLPTHHLNKLYIEIKDGIKAKINIWELIECVSINELIEFYIFFKKSEINKNVDRSFNSILYAFRHVRNICAHNSPFLIDLDSQLSGQNTTLKELLKPKKPEIDLSNKKIMDIASLLYLHKEFVTSDGIRGHRKRELKELLERVNRNPSYYTESYINKIFTDTDILIDILFV